MWIVPMQTASYKGVAFEVININDSAERAVVEHLYPYLNGGDLEDMGLNPKQVQLQAIFNGQGYYTELKRFLKVMAERSGGVLVHPIFGRMPNMLCTSYSVRHDAENINYCTLDLTFKEATETKSVRVFELPLFSQFDTYLNAIESYIEKAQMWYSIYMEAYSAVSSLKNKLMGYWGAMFGVYAQLQTYFKSQKAGKALPKSVSVTTLKSQSLQAIALINEAISERLSARYQRNALSATVGFDEVLRAVREVEAFPSNLVTGKGETATNRYDYLNLGGVKLTQENAKAISCALKLLCSAHLARIAVEVMEANYETLTPHEIETMTTQVRLQLLEALNAVRTLQQADEASKKLAQPNSDMYMVSYQMMESIRQLASNITQLAITLINQKPPLVIKVSPLNGTLQQVAHAFYGDYRRFEELLRLNPAIRQPNFIQEGDLLNAYAK